MAVAIKIDGKYTTLPESLTQALYQLENACVRAGRDKRGSLVELMPQRELVYDEIALFVMEMLRDNEGNVQTLATQADLAVADVVVDLMRARTKLSGLRAAAERQRTGLES